MALFDNEDFSVSDSGGAPPASPLVVPGEPGIGLAPAGPGPAAQPETPFIEKLGLGLMGFGHAVSGKGGPNPVQTHMENQKKARLIKLQEFKAETDALEDSVKWSQKLTGDDRTKFVNIRAQQLNEQKPGLGDQFRTFSDQPDLVTKFREYMPHLSEPLQLMLKTNPDGFMKFAASAEGIKALTEAKDKSTLRLATKKAQTAVAGWQKFVPPDVAANYNKDGLITASEFMDMQKYIPEAARMDDGELEVAMKTPGFWQALNIVGPADEAAVNKQRLIDQGKNKAESEIGKIRADEKAGRITKNEADARIAKLNRQGEGDDRLTPATVSVNGKNIAALVDKQGNYYDANTRQRISGGIGPQISEADERRQRELTGRQEGVVNLEKSVDALEKIVKNNPRSAAGLFSPVARGVEYVSGSLNPEGKGTAPGTQAVQLRDSILAGMGSLGRLSNQDRQRIENALQVGTGGNPKNLPLAIDLLRNNIKKEKAEVGAGRARPQAGGGKKDYSSMSDDELLKALSGG